MARFTPKDTRADSTLVFLANADRLHASVFLAFATAFVLWLLLLLLLVVALSRFLLLFLPLRLCLSGLPRLSSALCQERVEVQDSANSRRCCLAWWSCPFLLPGHVHHLADSRVVDVNAIVEVRCVGYWRILIR